MTLKRYTCSSWLSSDWFLWLGMEYYDLYMWFVFIHSVAEDNCRSCSPSWLVLWSPRPQIWFQAYFSFSLLGQVLLLDAWKLPTGTIRFLWSLFPNMSYQVSGHMKKNYVIAKDRTMDFSRCWFFIIRSGQLMYSHLRRCGFAPDFLYFFIFLLNDL